MFDLYKVTLTHSKLFIQAMNKHDAIRASEIIMGVIYKKNDPEKVNTCVKASFRDSLFQHYLKCGVKIYNACDVLDYYPK